MSGPPQLTGAQRAAAIDRAGENIALLSGAGCGKTFVLARRFTELLMMDRAGEGLDGLVALTFTERAAMEMSSRVREMLGDFASAAKGDDRARLLDWLQELPEARISTIHSFCSSLLRAYAIEAGVDPDFAVCSDTLAADMMVAEAAEQAVLKELEDGSERAASAVDLFGFDQSVRLVGQLVDRRTEWTAGDYSDPDSTLARWEANRQATMTAVHAELAADREFRAMLDEARSAHCGTPDDKLAVFRAGLLGGVDELLSAGPLRAAEIVGTLCDKSRNVGSPAAWGGKEGKSRVVSLLGAIVDRMRGLADIFAPLGPADSAAAEALAALTQLAGRANALYAADKRRRGLLDFTDLLDLVGRLLSERGDIRKAVASRIDQLLVDEAQDTSGFQISLIERLVVDDSGAAAGGKLFLVGDAKQSIYRFRGAQVEVFEDLCARLGAGHQERLDTSFRTHRAGVEFVNRLFAPLMGEAYDPIRAHRQACPEGPSVEIILAAPPEGDIASADQAAELQARVVASRIRELIDAGEPIVWDRRSEKWRPPRYRDVAVLLARMTKSPMFERALGRAGVPYYVIAGTGFFRQQEVFDVLNALRAADDARDDVSLFGFLRGRMVALDDNALVRIAESLDPPYWPGLAGGTIPEGLSPEDADALRFAVGLLDRLRRKKDAVGIDELIGELLAETGYEAALLARPNGRRMLGNVRLLVEQARAAAESGMALAGFLAQSIELTINEARYEQASVAAEGDDVVRVLTIHKAKGLEFPIVVMPDLNAAHEGPRGPLLISDAWGLVCKLQTEGEDNDEGDGEEEDAHTERADEQVSSAWRLARLEEKTASAAEDRRKFYVAATRHKDRLILVGADWRTKTGALRASRSFIAAMDRVLGISAALEAGADSISYGSPFSARLVRQIACADEHEPGRQGKAAKALASATAGDELVSAIAANGAAGGSAGELPLIGPIPATTGNARLAVTALCDFAHCPMLYRWRHELRAPAPAREGARPVDGQGGVGPAEMGTLFHRCMELLDFDRPQAARSLVARVAAEMDLDERLDADAATGDLEAMLDLFRRGDLFGRISSAKTVLRELAFVIRTSAGTLNGQIDLAFEDAGGAWRIVDYKSDRVAATELARRAERYRLQMMVYALALADHLGAAPAGASLWFLRPGASHAFDVGTDSLVAARREIDALAEALLCARRTGNFDGIDASQCDGCPYGPLRKWHGRLAHECHGGRPSSAGC